MRINCRRGDVDVPEQYLHDARIDAAFQEPCCIAMAERMRRDMSCNAGLSSCLPDGIPQHFAVNRCTSAAVGTKPAIIAMGQPKTAQFVEDRLGERNSTFFVTLTDDTDKQIDLIDSRDLKRGGLADAQTARIHEKEPALVDGILDAPEDRANLCIREDVGQTLVLGRPNFFFENS